MDKIEKVLHQSKTRIEVVYAGGTISSLATPQGYREGGHVVDLIGQLEEKTPGMLGRFEIGEAEVAYTGLSENIDETYWKSIDKKVEAAIARGPTGVVITHGTDSMEQTARHLQAKFIDTLRAKDIKIILTGANDDLATPDTDAWGNLAFAFKGVDSSEDPGVYVAFHDKLITAGLVTKEPYNGVTMNYSSSDDPAYIEAIERQEESSRQLIGQLEKIYGHHKATDIFDYPVNRVRINHQDLLERINANSIRAVLLTLYHSGTANTEEPQQSVAELATTLQGKGITVFAVTENGEPVNLGAYETSVLLREAGIVPLGMIHDVALAKLQLLPSSLTPKQLKEEMLTDRVGELQ